ncbi:hypothetical protein [Streptomyces sp. NPDC086519]|uniref:hypothetical protein n=1 Tax=Streptomyces sp. NPDC086519 TaxID=3154863 RepID=UPI00344AFF29
MPQHRRALLSVGAVLSRSQQQSPAGGPDVAAHRGDGRVGVAGEYGQEDGLL